ANSWAIADRAFLHGHDPSPRAQTHLLVLLAPYLHVWPLPHFRWSLFLALCSPSGVSHFQTVIVRTRRSGSNFTYRMEMSPILPFPTLGSVPAVRPPGSHRNE